MGLLGLRFTRVSVVANVVIGVTRRDEVIPPYNTACTNEGNAAYTTTSPTPHHQRQKSEPCTHFTPPTRKMPLRMCKKMHSLWISFGITLHQTAKSRKTPHTNTIEQLFVKIAKIIEFVRKSPEFFVQ